jgi:glycosyltransferase involved in cell wall biosynthesis
MIPTKPKIAIFINGGIATGHFSEGDAVITQHLAELAKAYSLTIFSLVKTDTKQVLPFRVIDLPFDHQKNVWLRTSLLFLKFLRHQILHPAQIFHGFGGFPAGFLAVLLGKFFRKKSVVTLLGGEYITLPSIQYGLWQHKRLRPFLRFTLQKTDELVILTDTAARQIKENFPFERAYHKIPFGINTQLFTPNPKNPTEPFRFLHVASLNRVKNQSLLLHVFQQINEVFPAYLTLIGEDNLNGQLQQLANTLGIAHKVTFIARVSHYDLPVYYAQADLLLHTSYSESQATVVNEALACGVVVCGTRVGIIADLEGQITTAVTVEDGEELTKKALELLSNPQKYNDLREKGIAWSKKNNLEVQAQKYIDLYRTLLTTSN